MLFCFFYNTNLVNNAKSLERYNSTALKNNLEKKVLYTTVMVSRHQSLKQGRMLYFLSFYIVIDLWWDGLRGSCRLKLFPSSTDHELDTGMVWTLNILKDKNFSQRGRESRKGRKEYFSFCFTASKANAEPQERLKSGDSDTQLAVPNCVPYNLMASMPTKE